MATTLARRWTPEWACPDRPLGALARSVAVAAACVLAVVGTWYALSCRVDADGKLDRSFFDIWPRQQREPAPVVVDDLEAALRGAADANRTLVLSVLNAAYAAEEGGLLDLFMESLRRGEGTAELIPRLLLVATDAPAFLRCQSLGGVRCYRLPPGDDGDELSSEQVYMSEGFVRMMWRRVRLLGDVLRHGYSFVFTDMDVMLLRNPFPGLNRTMEEDLLMSCDRFNGAAEDLGGNDLNTGFFFVAASGRTAALFDEWHAARESNASADMKEQDVLNRMARAGACGRLGVLDTARFSGFCQDSGDGRQVATVHANCCRTIRAKVADLRAVLAAAAGLINGTAAAGVAWPAHTECVKSWG